MSRNSRRPTTRPPVGGAALALRPQLEQRRLDLRALFRTLDQLRLAQDMPDELHELFELDADLAEALCVLDRPPPGMNWNAMLEDTHNALASLDDATAAFLNTLRPALARHCAALAAQVRPTLTLEDAYLDIPRGGPRRG
jgi:hypothetical protein